MAKRAKNRKRGPQPGAAPAPRTEREDAWLIAKAALLVALGFFIYWPALNGDWLWDDRDLIADNALVRDPGGLWKIWLQPAVMFDFLPLKISVEWIEWRLFGEETLGYHLVSLALHLTSALLLWRLFWKLDLRYAWLGAVIFTVHPLQVESVAWIAELKNTLSLPFFLVTMIAWVNYEARGKRADYLLALVMFLLAMLSKPTMVMFPFVILLYAWWRRGRLGPKDLLASAPFFAISLAVGLATAWFLSRTVGEQHVILGGPLSRLACAGLSVAFYFSKCVLPLDLMTIYPQWKVDPPTPLQFLPWLVLAGVLAFLWTKRTAWGRHALLGLGFFLLNLVPFVGFTAGSYMNYTWVMDHLVYIPIIGPVGLTIAAAQHVASLLPPAVRPAPAWALGAIALAMTVISHEAAGDYASLEALWGHNVALNPGGALPHNDLGVAYARQGRFDDALAQFRIAAQLDPRYTDAHHNLGLMLLQSGRAAEAVPELEAAQRLIPNDAGASYDLGAALSQSGREDEAIAAYQHAIELNPRDTPAYNNLAVSLANAHRLGEAIAITEAGLKIDPGNAQLQGNLSALRERQQSATRTRTKAR